MSNSGETDSSDIPKPIEGEKGKVIDFVFTLENDVFCDFGFSVILFWILDSFEAVEIEWCSKF